MSGGCFVFHFGNTGWIREEQIVYILQITCCTRLAWPPVKTNPEIKGGVFVFMLGKGTENQFAKSPQGVTDDGAQLEGRALGKGRRRTTAARMRVQPQQHHRQLTGGDEAARLSGLKGNSCFLSLEGLKGNERISV